MDRRDVLAGLEEIGWAGLQHAYGPADDVPGLLRVLASGSRGERQRAVHQLYGNIFHQGSRYEATAYAVPFLARLAADQQTPQRAEILYLLVAVAIGYDEAHLPAGVDIRGWRAGVDRLRSVDPAQRLRELGEWVAAAPDEAQRRVRRMHRAVYDHSLQLRSAQDELAAYDAVRAEVTGLRVLLGEDDPRLRAATAYLLGWFPEEAAASAAAFRALLTAETHLSVAASAVVAAGLLGEVELIPRLRGYLSRSGPLLRWAAAIALARLGAADAQVIGALATACVDPPRPGPGPGVRFLDGNLRGYAAQTLAMIHDRLPEYALDAVVDGLARTSEIAAFTMTTAALQLAFPNGPSGPLPPFAELTGQQQRVVRTLAELGPATWRWGNFMLIMQAWSLPSTRAGCRIYAGHDSAHRT